MDEYAPTDLSAVAPPPDILRLKGLDGEWIVHRQVGDTLYLFPRNATGYDYEFVEEGAGGHVVEPEDSYIPGLTKASVNDIIDEIPIEEPNVGDWVLFRTDYGDGEHWYLFGHVHAETLHDGVPIAYTVPLKMEGGTTYYEEWLVDHNSILDVVDASQVKLTCWSCGDPESNRLWEQRRRLRTERLTRALWPTVIAVIVLGAVLTMLAN